MDPDNCQWQPSGLLREVYEASDKPNGWYSLQGHYPVCLQTGSADENWPIEKHLHIPISPAAPAHERPIQDRHQSF